MLWLYLTVFHVFCRKYHQLKDNPGHNARWVHGFNICTQLWASVLCVILSKMLFEFFHIIHDQFDLIFSHLHQWRTEGWTGSNIRGPVCPADGSAANSSTPSLNQTHDFKDSVKQPTTDSLIFFPLILTSWFFCFLILFSYVNQFLSL